MQEKRIGKTLRASLSHRWLIVGTSGCGKTTLCKRLVKELYGSFPAAGLYILDSKQDGDFDNWPNRVMTDTAPAPIAPGGMQVWQPGLDNQDAYDKWFSHIFLARQPAIVLIDELSSVTGKNGKAPMNFQRLMKQGRGLGISVINCTQELASIPRQARTQAIHVMRFRLVPGYDAIQGNKLVRRDNQAPEPKEHGFFYARTDRPGDAVEYTSINNL